MPKLNYTEHQVDLLLTGIYVGAINAHHLPKHLYESTAEVLISALKKGFKTPIHNAKI